MYVWLEIRPPNQGDLHVQSYYELIEELINHRASFGVWHDQLLAPHRGTLH
jgi:hypothetical protein